MPRPPRNVTNTASSSIPASLQNCKVSPRLLVIRRSLSLVNPESKQIEMSQELCAITSRPARYHDPQTGLPYANAFAYREIHHALANRYAWSRLLGCYVGPIGVGARGVPERFLAPNAPPPQLQTPATSTSCRGGGGEGGSKPAGG